MQSDNSPRVSGGTEQNECSELKKGFFFLYKTMHLPPFLHYVKKKKRIQKNDAKML